jgi:hypothetical protein
MTTRKPGRPKGIPNPNGGRKPKGASRRTEHTITLDPTILLLVQGHAKARGDSLSESVNTLLGEALRHHEVDKETGEVY